MIIAYRYGRHVCGGELPLRPWVKEGGTCNEEKAFNGIRVGRHTGGRKPVGLRKQ